MFAAHQVQHLLIRLLAPLLFVLARPWPVLSAGLPRSLRRSIRDLGRHHAIALTARAVTRLPVAFLLLVGWFYLWQAPVVHNAAIGAPALTLLAHLGMALIAVILSNILLGSLTTLKEKVMYTGYDKAGRLWDIRPMADETFGGYTIWVPSSFVIIATLLLVMHGWNAAEARRWYARHVWAASNSATLEFPETAHELRLKTDGPNRLTGLTLALVSTSVFATVLITIVAVVYLM